MDDRITDNENIGTPVSNVERASLEKRITSFRPEGNDILAALLMYPTAYFYVYRDTRFWLLLFTAGLVTVCELVSRTRKRSAESWFLLSCLTLVTACYTFTEITAWDEEQTLLIAHLLGVWWILARNDRLLEGTSGRLIPFDAFRGFFLYPLRGFINRIGTVFFALTHAGENRKKRDATTIIWTFISVAAAAGLFIGAASLLGSADDRFGELVSGILDDLTVNLPEWTIGYIIVSLPVGAYLFGLISESAASSREQLSGRKLVILSRLEDLRKVPNRVWNFILFAFAALYLIFFGLQGSYLFGAIAGRLPDGFTAAEYARQGFFELCKVMALNFLVIWLAVRLSRVPVREERTSKTAVTLILIQSMLLAFVSFSKLYLYISRFGFTPKRIQACWMVCVLFAGCICALITLYKEKCTFRWWLMFGTATVSLLHLI